MRNIKLGRRSDSDSDVNVFSLMGRLMNIDSLHLTTRRWQTESIVRNWRGEGEARVATKRD